MEVRLRPVSPGLERVEKIKGLTLTPVPCPHSYPDFYYTRKIQIGSIVGVSGDIVHPDATALLTALSDYYASGSPQIGTVPTG